MQPVKRALLLIALLVVAGCGGGGGGGEATQAQPGATEGTPTDVQTVTVPNTADPNATPSGEPAFEAGLTAQSHAPAAGTAWRWTVIAKKGGQPAAATAKMRVFVDGVLVNTLGWFPFEGRLTQSYSWPRSLKGKQAVFQAEVEGEGGTQRVNWPVSVS